MVSNPDGCVVAGTDRLSKLIYSIILLCLGRHPLQNPHYIKPDVGKLSKSIVDRIPLVIYIPPPPDAAAQPISLPKPIHTYPPKPLSTVFPKKRFAFLPWRVRKGKGEGGSEDKKMNGSKELKEVETWEDNWEQCEYPFVRLDGNRAACAICLMDFEEPRRLVGDNEEQQNDRSASLQGEQIIPVERITEEERVSLPRLQDAGEGPQPLRLLACGHVFHVSEYHGVDR